MKSCAATGALACDGVSIFNTSGTARLPNTPSGTFTTGLQMIYHCTKALAAKIPEVSSEALRAAHPLDDWHAHLYLIDRRQCVMFCHDTTRFTVFCAGLRKEQFKGLAQLHKEGFRAALISLGVGESAIKRAELAMGEAFFDTATDRSVLGALRQARSDMDGYLSNYGSIMDVDPVALERWLNDRPVSARGVWLWPEKEMLELVGKNRP